MKKFCATPAMAIILKVSAIMALIIFIGSLVTDIQSVSDTIKQMELNKQVIESPMKIQIVMKVLTDLLLMLGLPSMLWLLADGVLLLRAMYFGDDGFDDEDVDGCCCGQDHVAPAAVDALVVEKSAE